MIYGGNAFGTLGDLEECVNKTVAAIKGRIHEFDSIVVRGVSGMVVGAPVALAVHKPLVVVRKPDEKSHDSCTVLVNRPNMGEWCVFLDDFSCTGATEAQVRDAVEHEGAQIGECFFYHHILNGGGWRRPVALPQRPRSSPYPALYNSPPGRLKVRYRGEFYDAEIIRRARVRVLVGFAVPRKQDGYYGLATTPRKFRSVWLHEDDERLMWS